MAYYVMKAMENHAAITNRAENSIQKNSFKISHQSKTCFFRGILSFHAKFTEHCLNQGCQTRGPRDACDIPSPSMRPA